MSELLQGNTMNEDNNISKSIQAVEPEPTQSEPTQPEQANPYQTIIDQQNEQIAALIEQNSKLTGQITQMVQNGVQFYQPSQPAQPQPKPQPMQYVTPSLADENDWSLESLAKEIGKRGD